jgi:pimeloyl-ACP methyl ester carboxylesterase
MASKKQEEKPRTRRARRRGKSKAHRESQDGKKRLWRWLGMGAQGLATYALWQRPKPGAEGPSLLPEEPPGDDLFQLPPEAEESWIAGPTGSLRLVEVNAGAPVAVLFVHGLGGCLEQWAGALARAGEGLHAIALDLPGHGGSDPRSGAPVKVLAASLGAVLDSLSLRRAVIVAHSLGALAALRYAADHDDRVAGLFLVDPTGDQTRIPEAERRELIAALREDAAGEMSWHCRQLLATAPAEISRRVLEQLGAVGARALEVILESSLGVSPAADADAYGGALFLLLSESSDLPWSLHSLRPEIPAVSLPGASHWLMLERPGAFWELLLDFLGDLRQRSLV